MIRGHWSTNCTRSCVPGNQTHDLGIASTMLYCLSKRNKLPNWLLLCCHKFILSFSMTDKWL